LPALDRSKRSTAYKVAAKNKENDNCLMAQMRVRGRVIRIGSGGSTV